jgi:hypothetical protein
MTTQTGLFADNSFYRTTPMDPAEQNKAEIQAVSQEDKILQHLRETGKELTAWQLKDVFPTFEITSIRRSLFNLEMKACEIVQTGWVKERKGVKVGTYKSK